jgi:hypothetical protein
MVVKKLKALETYYAFGTLKFGLHVAEINIKKSQINQQNTFLRGKSIRDIYEYSVGKLIVCVSSSNELWLVDYLAMTEKRLVSTFGPPLTIRKIHDGFKKFDNLFLIREKDWLCIFNRKFKYYTRILKIPSYIYQESKYPSNQYMQLLPNDTTEDIEFLMIWGRQGRKVAKLRVAESLMRFLDNYDPRPDPCAGSLI